jgi:hypothetical protein
MYGIIRKFSVEGGARLWEGSVIRAVIGALELSVLRILE